MEHADVFQIHFPNHISNNTQLEHNMIQMLRFMIQDVGLWIMQILASVDIKCRYIL